MTPSRPRATAVASAWDALHSRPVERDQTARRVLAATTTEGDAPAAAPVDVLIVLESAADRPTVEATLAALAAGPVPVGRVTLVGDPAWVAGLATPSAGAGPTVASASALRASDWVRGLGGRDGLVVAGAAALGRGALAALRAAVAPFRIGAASAASAAGHVLVATWAEAGPDGCPPADAEALAAELATAPPTDAATIGAAEPACTLFAGHVLARLDDPPDVAASALVEGLSFALSERGFWRVAAPGAVAYARPGWRPAPSPDPRVAAKHAALRGADGRRLGGGTAARRVLGASRRPRVAIDLAGMPYHGPRMNGTRRMCYAAARAIDARLGDGVDLHLAVDDAAEAGRIGVRSARVVDDWATVPTAHIDATFRPAQFFSQAAVLEVARASRSFSVVVLDLISYHLEDIGVRHTISPEGPSYDLDPVLERRAVMDLALTLCRRAHAISVPARDELAMAFAHRPEVVTKLGVVPLCDLRDPLPTPVAPRGVGRRPFFLWVGNAFPHKNPAQALRAWVAARRARPDLPDLVLLGLAAPPPGLVPPDQAGAVTGLVDVEDGEVEWLYRHATAVVSSSLWEGFGLPIVEAAAAGAAVLAARTPASEALLGAGHPGLFVETAALADLLTRASLDPTPLRAPACSARVPRAAFEDAVVADIEAQLADPPTARPWLPLDPRALVMDPPRYRTARASDTSFTTRVGRSLLRRSPFLWRLGKFVLDEARGATRGDPA